MSKEAGQSVNIPQLEIVQLRESAVLPTRAYLESAGLDLYADLMVDGRTRHKTIANGAVTKVPTGIAIRPPKGHCALVCSRSGLAMSGVFVVNAPGVVDPDYTGEVMVLLGNCAIQPQYITHGMRIAQLIITPYISPVFREVKTLPQTERNAAGFGSTGR